MSEATDLGRRFRRWLAWGVAVAALLYVAGSLYAGIGEVGDALYGFASWLYVPVLGLTLVNYGLRFWKWHFLIGRLGGFPKEVVVKKGFPDDPKEFLKEVAKDTWRFFNEIVDQEHGLPLDTIQLGKTEAVGEGTWIGDYTNVTNIGVYLMGVVSAFDLGFITKEDAVKRLQSKLAAIGAIQHTASL